MIVIWSSSLFVCPSMGKQMHRWIDGGDQTGFSETGFTPTRFSPGWECAWKCLCVCLFATCESHVRAAWPFILAACFNLIGMERSLCVYVCLRMSNSVCISRILEEIVNSCSQRARQAEPEQPCPLSGSTWSTLGQTEQSTTRACSPSGSPFKCLAISMVFLSQEMTLRLK